MGHGARRRCVCRSKLPGHHQRAGATPSRECGPRPGTHGRRPARRESRGQHAGSCSRARSQWTRVLQAGVGRQRGTSASESPTCWWRPRYRRHSSFSNLPRAPHLARAARRAYAVQTVIVYKPAAERGPARRDIAHGRLRVPRACGAFSGIRHDRERLLENWSKPRLVLASSPARTERRGGNGQGRRGRHVVDRLGVLGGRCCRATQRMIAKLCSERIPVAAVPLTDIRWVSAKHATPQLSEMRASDDCDASSRSSDRARKRAGCDNAARDGG